MDGFCGCFLCVFCVFLCLSTDKNIPCPSTPFPFPYKCQKKKKDVKACHHGRTSDARSIFDHCPLGSRWQRHSRRETSGRCVGDRGADSARPRPPGVRALASLYPVVGLCAPSMNQSRPGPRAHTGAGEIRRRSAAIR